MTPRRTRCRTALRLLPARSSRRTTAQATHGRSRAGAIGRLSALDLQRDQPERNVEPVFVDDAAGDLGQIAGGWTVTITTNAACGTPTPTPTATATPSCTPGWSGGAPLPSVGVRSVGVYFPANGKFYAMGGRSADTAGSDFMHPFEYNPATNSWTTKGATYADNQVNNMACAVLTDAGTPYIYCVGGSAAGQAAATDRVFRYNPVTDVISPVASPGPVRWEPFCLVASVSSTTSSTSLADLTTLWGWSIRFMSSLPTPPAGTEERSPARPARLYTHHHHRQLHLHRGWQHVRSHCDPRRFD